MKDDDDPGGNFSLIHVSAMNYRYQFSGVPGFSGIYMHQYSNGYNPFAACYTSPKARCELDALAAQAQYGNPQACMIFDPFCDTDVQEWNYWVTLDFVGGTKNTNPGVDPSQLTSTSNASTSSVSTDAVAPVDLARLSASEYAPILAAFGRNMGGPAAPSNVKALANKAWNGAAPGATANHKRSLANAQIADLQRRGLKRDKDFQVSADGLQVLQSCL